MLCKLDFVFTNVQHFKSKQKAFILDIYTHRTQCCIQHCNNSAQTNCIHLPGTKQLNDGKSAQFWSQCSSSSVTVCHLPWACKVVLLLKTDRGIGCSYSYRSYLKILLLLKSSNNISQFRFEPQTMKFYSLRTNSCPLRICCKILK